MSTELEPVDVVRAPARLSSALAVAFAAGAVVAMVPSLVGFAAGLAGGVALAVGLFARDSRRLVDIGAAGLVGGALLSGAFGLAVELVLVAATGGVLAWDLAENAFTTGRQLGRTADTARGELVHAAASVVVGVAVATTGYVVYQVAAGGQPVAALALLVAGAVLVLWGARQ